MTRHVALFAAAIVALSAFAGSVRPSAAFDPNLLTDPGYATCLQYAATYASRYPAGAERDAAYAKLRQNCDRTYLSKRLNLD